MEQDRAERLLQMPRNVKQVGRGESKELVYLEDYVVSFMEYIGRNTTSNQEILVLIGKAIQMEENICYFVRGAIEANDYIDISEDGKQCWCQWKLLLTEIERYFPGDVVLGWAQIGMEECPKRKDTLAFGEEAICREPALEICYHALKREREVFVIKEEQRTRLEKYYIYYDKNNGMQEYMLFRKGNPSKEKVEDEVTKQLRKKIQQMESRKKEKQQWKYGGRICILLGIVGMSILVIRNQEKSRLLEDTLSSMKNEQLKQTEQGRKLKESKKQAKSEQGEEAGTVACLGKEQESETKKAATGDNVEEIIEKKKTNETKEIAETKQTAEEQKEGEEMADLGGGKITVARENVETQVAEGPRCAVPQYYEIQHGDTLEGICKTYLKESDAVKRVMQLNGIEDKNRIKEGTIIKLWE